MSKHSGFTPGPWRLDERNGGGYRVTATEEHVTFVDSSRYPDGRRDKEAEANARLIAAAPDLLAENERLRARVAELESLARWSGSLAERERTDRLLELLKRWETAYLSLYPNTEPIILADTRAALAGGKGE